MIGNGVLQSIQRWDVWTFERIVSSPLHGALLKTARVVSGTGDGWLYAVFPLSLFVSDHDDAVAYSYLFVIAFIVERVLYFCLKNGFRRRRPPNVVEGYKSYIIPPDEFSFPSGHTSGAFLMVSVLSMAYGPSFMMLYLWSIGVGISRMILGVHFPTDILVGALMGAGIAFVVFGIPGLQ